MTRFTTAATLPLVFVVACARTPPAAAPVDCATQRTGDRLSAAFLDGTWRLELQVTSRELRYQPPSAPFPPANEVRGTITFDMRTLASTRDSVLAQDAPFRGVIQAPFDSLLARTPPGWDGGVVPFAHRALGAPDARSPCSS